MDKQERNYYSMAAAIIVIIILAACGNEISTTPTVPTPTKQPTFTPLLQITKTPGPIGRMEPTLAYWATAQENRFNSIYTQIAETKVAVFDLATQFPQLCGFDTEGVFLSPNGEWIANDCRYSTGEFRVFQTNGHTAWIIPLSKLFDNYPSDAGSVDALHWSTNGKLLYFTNSACCPDVDTLSTGDTLFVFNLQTGDWRPLIKGHFNFYSFSPDERYLVYILNNQANANSILNLHVIDQNTGEKTPINIGEFEQAGYAVWKQNGMQLALTTQIGNMYDENRKYSLVALDLQKRTSKNIILNSNDLPYVKDWSNDDLLTIQINQTTEYADYYISHYDTLYYDLKTNQFTPVPVSP